MFKYPFPRWDVALWCALIAFEVVLEVFGLRNANDATLTALICDTIPSWGRAMILGWLVWHFLIQNK